MHAHTHSTASNSVRVPRYYFKQRVTYRTRPREGGRLDVQRLGQMVRENPQPGEVEPVLPGDLVEKREQRLVAQAACGGSDR